MQFHPTASSGQVRRGARNEKRGFDRPFDRAFHGVRKAFPRRGRAYRLAGRQA